MSEKRRDTETIQVKVNGKTYVIIAGSSVRQLIEQLGISLQGTAVELAGEIIPPNRYLSTLLEDGDCLELVRLVGGG